MPILDYKEYARISRQAASEGMVLLENKNNTLPLVAGSKLTLLGRIQFDTYFTGTGSGGMVNVPYVVSINDALKDSYDLESTSQNDYKTWLKDNPFDPGTGWGTEPWSQVEMPISSEQMQGYSLNQETALVVIGRTAGEDRDNQALPGAYYLSEDELNLIKLARENFEKLIIVLNTANIIDTSWQLDIEADVILYMWQGGSETGNALADILTGYVNPSGHLPDTVANKIEDYPAHDNFGAPDKNIYEEDIYVGYRYFETFAPDKVQYPFGYGLSYTSFATCDISSNYVDGYVQLKFTVENTGSTTGKAVPQVYISAPQGNLGKAKRVLVDFEKTRELEPGEKQYFEMEIPEYYFASYDDDAKTDYTYSYVLEAGKYEIYLGFDVRSAEQAGEFYIEKLKLIEQLQTASGPEVEIERFKTGAYDLATDTYSLEHERLEYIVGNNKNTSLGHEVEIERDTTDTYDFSEYLSGDISAVQYLNQFSDFDLIELSRGRVWSNDGVRAGVTGVLGATTKRLKESGLVLVSVVDGPSGIRLDDGSMAFQVPIGTALSSTFNKELNKKLYEFMALELRKNDASFLLGPGVNIHRHPLNGRNFEYFSEDPLLTAKIAGAQVDGLWTYQTTGTIKHFSVNNQEYERTNADSIVSERALREIYLKPYELIVKNTYVQAIMSSYNPINGVWSAGNKDIHTRILRDEWNYQGLVMTDWWAKMNWTSGGEATRNNLGAMIRAQNDLYMVINPGEERLGLDEALTDLAEGRISRAELLRNAENIIRVIRGLYNPESEVQVQNEPEQKTVEEQKINIGHISTSNGDTTNVDVSKLVIKPKHRHIIAFNLLEDIELAINIVFKSKLTEMAQQNVILSINNRSLDVLHIRGQERVSKEFNVNLPTGNHAIEIYYTEGGLDVEQFGLQVL